MDIITRENTPVFPRIFRSFFRDVVDSSSRQSQQGLAENCSAGGMFIATNYPFSRAMF